MRRLLIPLMLMLALMLALVGCASNDAGCVRLSIDAGYCLSNTAGPVFDTEQSTVVDAAGRRLQLIARIQSDADGLRFAGVTPLGQTIIHASYGPDGITTQLAPGMADKIDGAVFLALVQVATWPGDVVRQGLRGAATLREFPGRRTILRGNDVLLDIAWQGVVPPYDNMHVEIPAARVTVDARALNKEETE